jgi:hypothetical protein
VLESYGPAITQALRRLDRATTVARKAVSLAEVTDNEWQLGGDEAWLGLEVGGIGGPGPQQRIGVLGGHREGVDEGDRSDLLGQLVGKRDALVHLHALQHHGLL